MKVKNNVELTDEELNYTKFFDFWNDVAIVKTQTVDQLNSCFSSPYRYQIVDVMAIGIEDEYPGRGKMLRHALSGKEIMELIKEKHGQEISKSNLYFHLNALIEGGCVYEVGTVASGKRFTSYYGRTAKAFLTIKTGHGIHDILYKDYFRDILHKLNANVNDKEIDEILKKLKPITSYDDTVFAEWVEKCQKVIFDVEIDMRHLANFASVLYRYNLDVGEGIDRLSELLKVKEIDFTNREVDLKVTNPKANFRELSTNDMFGYWSTLQPVKVFSNSTYTSLFGHSQPSQIESSMLRSWIISVLKEGRRESNPETGKLGQRTLLTASEILEDVPKLAEKFGKAIDIDKIKPSALYFHLDKLEKHGLIQTIGYVTNGRKRVSYYGRTAKYFTYNELISEGDTYPILKSPGFQELVLRQQRDITKIEFQRNVETLDKLNKYDPLALHLWLKNTKINIDDIKLETSADEIKNVDLVEISTIISICQRFTPDVIRALNDLANWMRFEQAK